MNTPTILHPRRRFRRAEQHALRFRAQLPAVTVGFMPPRPAAATHDLLIANPRPDLVDAAKEDHGP